MLNLLRRIHGWYDKHWAGVILWALGLYVIGYNLLAH